MDKIQALVWSLYTSGIRAYHRADEQGRSVTYFQKADGSRWPHEGAYIWDQLRSYQDAERKKGTPITFYPGGYDEQQWRQLKGPLARPIAHYYGAYTESDKSPMQVPFIKTYDSRGRDLALFTNFRWRAGYPKGGEHAN